jgi:hypothetical protein
MIDLEFYCKVQYLKFSYIFDETIQQFRNNFTSNYTVNFKFKD